MSDDRIDELFDQVRQLDADRPALARIKRRVLERSERRPIGYARLAIVGGAGLALAVWWLTPRATVEPDPVADAGEWTELPSDAERTWELESGRAVARGPARVRVDGETLMLASGFLDVDGHARVEATGCEVCVDGHSTIESLEAGARVIVLAGTARPDGEAWACRFEELDVPDSTDDSAVKVEEQLELAEQPRPRRPRRSERTSSRSGRGDASGTSLAAGIGIGTSSTSRTNGTEARSADEVSESSTLAEQVAAYRAAGATLRRDDARALTRLRAFIRTYPESTLRHEAALDILSALRRLERYPELLRESRAFIARWPASPRRDEVERLVEGLVARAGSESH